MRNLLLLALVGTLSLNAQDKPLWKASVVALAAADALDVHSSWGKHELNPVLSAGPNATFGGHSALLKLGLQGGMLGIEYLLIRRHPSAKLQQILAAINFGAAGANIGVAAHNYTIPRRP